MSHKLSLEEHTKLGQELQEGSQTKGYSHTVCVRKDKQDTWIKKGYVVIQDSSDSVMLGKNKVEEKEEE